MFKKIAPYIILLIVSLTPRLIAIGSIPVSLSHDEVDLVIQAHSVRLTGTDLNGTYKPWSFLPNDAVMAELGPVINLPILSIFPNSLLTAHITTALLGAVYPILILLFLFTLGFSQQISWYSAYLLALSPWHILFSRTTLEQPTSLFFYTLSWLIIPLIFKSKNKKSFILSTFSFLTFYLIGFYTYHGFKFVLPALTLIIAFWHYIEHKKFKRLLIIVSVVAALYARLFIYSDSYSSRSSEIILLNTDYFSQLVNLDRRISVLPKYVTSIISNKYTIVAQTLIDKYLYTLNPNLLFSRGEANGVFGTGRTPYLYLWLLPILIAGISTTILNPNKRNNLLIIILLISPLATVIHVNNAIAFRSAIYFVLLHIFASIGIDAFSKRYSKINLTPYILLLISFSTILFGLKYFAFYPVESSKSYFFSDKVLAKYLSNRTDHSILVIDPQPRYIMSYLVLNNKVIRHDDLLPLINHYHVGEEKNIFKLDNLTIRRDCPNDNSTYSTIIVDASIIDGLAECPQLKELQLTSYNIRKIADPLDSGGKKIIYNDSICKEIGVPAYLNPNKISDFHIDSMTREQFCTKWIIEN